MSNESVDDRIVSMKFDNQTFETRLSDTIKSLDSLNKTLQMTNGKQGLQDVAKAASAVDFSHMSTALDKVSSKFSTMGAIGFSVIQNLTTSAIQFAESVAHKVMDPLITGGKERSQNIEQAKFMFRGLGIDVEAGMKSALDAVRGTAYGLGDAAKAAAQLGASGIKVGDQMTSALRAIAGSAAMTGSSFREMSDIFTGSAGSGKVNNMDLQQFSTRGLNAAVAVGKVLNKTEAQVHEMAANGTLDFKTFSDAMDSAFGSHATQANELFSGALANMHAALSRIGASFFTPWLNQQRDLFNALSPVIDNINKSVQPLIGVFLQMTNVANVAVINFLKGLDTTKFSYGVQIISDGLGNIFNFLYRLRGIAADAFREFFPKSETSGFIEFATAFENFTEKLKMGGETASQIKHIFEAFFSVISVGWTIVKEFFGLFGLFSGSAADAGSSALGFADKIAQVITNFDTMLTKGEGIHNFFIKIKKTISTVITFFKNFTDGVTGVVDSVTNMPTLDVVKKFPGIEIVVALFDRMQTRFEAIGKVVGRVKDVLSSVGSWIADWFKHISSDIAGALKPGDFNSALDAVNIGLLGGLVVMFREFMKNGVKVDFLGGIGVKVNAAFANLTKTLQVMQANLRATTLLKLAAAIGILTASIVALSLIDSAALSKALAGIAVGFGELVGVMMLLDKAVSSTKDAAKLGILGGALIAVATAMVILSVAIKNLSSLDMGELAKGVAGVGAGLALLVASTKLMDSGGLGMVGAGIGMTAIAASMVVLAAAVKAFSLMSWESMAQGLVGIAASLAILVLAMNAMPVAQTLAAGAAMIPLAVGITILAGAVAIFSKMSLKDMAVGLLGVAATLLIVAAGMNAMPLTLPVTAAGLLILSGALNVMALAVLAMGAMDFGTLAKGIGGIAIMLGILVIAMNAMDGSIAGAASLVIVSGALVILTGVLKSLGELSIAELATGLGAIAAVLLILGGAALLLTPLIPSMLLLGAALTVIGAGFLLVGGAAFLIGKGFEALAGAGVAGAEAFVAALKIFISAIPDLLTELLKSIGRTVGQLEKSLELIVRLFGVLLSSILDVVIENVPKIVEALGEIIGGAIKLIREHVPDYIQMGFEILTALLTGIRDNIYNLVTLALEIVTSFAQALTDNMPMLVLAAVELITSFLAEVANHAAELVTAGLGLLISLLQGIEDNIDKVVAAVVNLITTFIREVGKGQLKILAAGFGMLKDLLKGIANHIIEVSKTVTDIVTNFINAMADNAEDIITAGYDALMNLLKGIEDNLENVINTVTNIITKFITAMGNSAQDIADAGAQALVDFLYGIEADLETVADTAVHVALAFMNAVADDTIDFTSGAADMLINFLNDLADVINQKGPEIDKAGIRVGVAIANAMTGGIVSKAKDIAKAAKDAAIDAFHAVADVISNPIGFITGLVGGGASAENKSKNATKAVAAAEKIVSDFHKSITKMKDPLSDITNFNPTITPVLDLTKVQLASRDLNSILSGYSITPTVSIDQARTIATTTQIANEGTVPVEPSGPSEIKFEQNIYSPLALSTNDIYRSTRSQIALAKEELGI